MKRSESIANLAAALALAQGEFEAAVKDHVAKVKMKNGGEYVYTFATLSGVFDAVRPGLSKNGLSFMQEPTVAGGYVSCSTLLMHSSGEWIETDPFPMPVSTDLNGSQAYGSALAYCRRYSFSSVIGLATEDDDDGNSGSGNDATTGAKPRVELPPCPNCQGGNASVIKGKEEYGSGLLCWKGHKTKPGCGHSWQTAEYPFTGKKATDPAHAIRPPAGTFGPPPEYGYASDAGDVDMGAQLEKQLQQSQAKHAAGNGEGANGTGSQSGPPAAASPSQHTAPNTMPGASDATAGPLKPQPVPGQKILFPTDPPAATPDVAKNAAAMKQQTQTPAAAANGNGVPAGSNRPASERLKDVLRNLLPAGPKRCKATANAIVSFFTGGQYATLDAIEKQQEACQGVLNMLAEGWTFEKIEAEMKADQPRSPAAA